MTVEQSSTTSTSKHGDTQTLFTFGPKKLTFGPDLFFYFWVKTLLTFGSKHFWLLDQNTFDFLAKTLLNWDKTVPHILPLVSTY